MPENAPPPGKKASPTGKTAPPTGTDADVNLDSLNGLFADEDKARAFLEARRWPGGPVCPHCKSIEIYRLRVNQNSQHPVRPGVYKCAKCLQEFTVRIGTVFEESKIPLRKWLTAFPLLSSSKKG